MTQHIRDTLLDRIATLIGGNSVPVSRSRVYPSKADQFPRYFVFWEAEEIDWNLSTKDGTMRFMTVKIEAARQVNTNAGVDQVETTLQADTNYLEELLERPEIDDTIDAMLERIGLKLHHQGDIPLGVVELTLTVQYRTIPGNAHSAF
jgi:hypothetical protein